MSSTPPNSPSDAAASAPLPPPRVPDHELIRRIGRGAYGEVWLARGVTGAYRAVKIVHRRSFDHDRPFEREFEGILKFEPISRRHDSQVDILHVGRGDDCFYYVMELADDQATGGQINPDSYAARTLKSDLVFHGRLPFEECVRISLALATALEHLHDAGLVHRDVKPSNIIFVNGVPKLADIGLVTGIDATRSYVGTEGFAAPEGPGTAQADIYSLGKVLYEIATGKDRQEFPDLPTQLRELPDREGLMELNAVIAKACRHDPKDRYTSATAMRADLELLQSGKSLARLHRVERRLRFIRRVGLTTGVVAVVALGAFWFQTSQTRQARKLAAENRRVAEENRVLADRNRAQINQLYKANGFRQMENGDIGGAIVWFADALKHGTDNSGQSEMDRRRVSMLLQMHPKPLARIPVVESGIYDSSFDGEHILMGSSNRYELWNLADTPHQLFVWPGTTNWARGRFSEDAKVVFFSGTNRPTIEIWHVDTATNIQRRKLNLGYLKNVRMFDAQKRIVAINTNNVLAVWDSETGGLVREVARIDGAVTDLVTAGDGVVTVTISDSLWRVFDWQTGQFLSETFCDAAHSRKPIGSNGRFHISRPVQANGRLATGKVEIWDGITGHLVGPPLSHEVPVDHGAISNDGRLAATADSQGIAVRIWNAETGELICPPIKFPRRVRGLVFSPDKTKLAILLTGSAVVYDTQSGRQVTPPLEHEENITLIMWELDGAGLLVVAGGIATIWDLASSAAHVMKAANPVQNMRFSTDGETLLTQFEEKSVLWKTGSWEPHVTIAHPAAKQCALDRNGNYLALAYRGKGSQVWDLKTGATVGPLIQDGESEFRHIKFDSPGKRLITSSADGTIRFWDWRQGQQLGAPLKHGVLQLHSFALSPTGDRLLSVASEKTNGTRVFREWLWNVNLRTLITNGSPQEDKFDGPHARFSPDGSKWIDFHPFVCRVMEAATGAPTRVVFNYNNTVIDAEFSPDGTSILSGALDQLAQIYDVTTGLLRAPPMQYPRRLSYLHFTDQGRQVAAGGFESWQWWEAATGLPMAPPLQTEFAVQSALHPGGRYFAMSTRDLRLLIYDTGKTLTDAEIRRGTPFVTGRHVSTNGTISFLPTDELLKVMAGEQTQSAMAIRKQTQSSAP